eukprot:1158406-Pelagomonas_calceolata.AAC.5
MGVPTGGGSGALEDGWSCAAGKDALLLVKMIVPVMGIMPTSCATDSRHSLNNASFCSDGKR